MIGVFDSGIGGLTVLKELITFLPQYHYIYLGDNARNPYGGRSDETVYEYTRQAVDFLFNKKKCEIVILACNTASAKALRRLQQEYLPTQNSPTKRILGVLIPTAQMATESSKGKKIGVIATKGTVESNSFEIELKKVNNSVKVFQHPAPLLVPLIEENWIGKPETNMILKKYLKPFKAYNIDTLILGCTHYPLLEKEIQRLMGKKIKLVSSGKSAGIKFADYLNRHSEIEELLLKDSKVEYLTTDDPNKFKEVSKHIFCKKNYNVEKVKLIP